MQEESEYWSFGNGWEEIIGYGFNCINCDTPYIFVDNSREYQCCYKCGAETKMRIS